MKFNTLLLLILTTYSLESYAQIFNIEQANSNVKWKQINTSQFQLIFPEKFTKAANKLANTIAIQISQSNENLTRKAKKISIIVQENTLDQNGFVQLAPRKSELYSTPSGIADNQPWLSSLSLHEMRHVAQFDNLTGKIHKPFGEQIALGLFALNLPTWYFEGDAVLHETLYSDGGRGRLASWQMPIRSNIQSNLDYDFNKYTHGSYKDIVPSYYTIGYFMNSEIYQKDEKSTSNIYKEMRGKLIRPFNFQRALKKQYGTNANGLFKKMMANLKETWSEKPTNPYPNRILFEDKYPTDYLLPQVQNNTIYSIQSGPQRVPRIVKTEINGTEKPIEITKLGGQIMPYFDMKKHLIVWDEYRRNARFSKETFNVINVYNTLTNEKKTITHETRYYTPILSPNLENIACIEVDEANNSTILILDILTGEKVKSIKTPSEIHIQQPQFNKEGTKIITIAVSDKGTNLLEFDLINNKSTLLTSWSNQQIERPIYDNEGIIYKSNIGNKDDIFRLENNELTRLTDTEFGAFNPFITQNTLYFNDYTTDGLKINSINTKDINAQPIEQSNIETLYSSQNTFKAPETNIDSNRVYEIEDYNGLSHAINFHSISFSGNDFQSFDNLKPGIFLLSNDILNTTQTKLGFEYDTNIQKTSYSAEISYQKYYPKITIGYNNRGLIGAIANQSTPDSIYYFDYRENLITADIQLPFVKFRGNNVYSYGINLGTSYQYRYNTSISNIQNFNHEIAFPMNYQVYLNKNTRRSRMDIFPRWGQNFSFMYRHLPFENQQNGTSWSFRSNFYFPGLAINHGLQLRYSMQKNNGRFANSINIPLFDGINHIAYKEINNTLLIDYRLPISYPDWSLGQVSYLKRIYAGIAANYLNIDDSGIKPQTISASLFFDFNVFKYTLPNFVLETKINYITTGNSNTKFVPVFSLSYNY